MPLICCSITCTTTLLTVVADAPGKVVLTCTVGGAIGGYCSMGSCVMDSPPANMMMSAMTIAKIGRLMKNFAMTRLLRGERRRARRRRLDGPHRGAGPHFLHAGDDHFFAFVQTVLDHPVGARRARRLDRAHRDAVVASDHQRGRVAARIVRHGGLRDERDIVLDSLFD